MVPGIEAWSEDEFGDDEVDLQDLVTHEHLDESGEGVIVRFSVQDTQSVQAAMSSLSKRLVDQTFGTKVVLPNPADADLFAELSLIKRDKGYAQMTTDQKRHLDRLERLADKERLWRKEELERQVLDFAATTATLSSEAREYTAAMALQNQAATSQRQADATSSYRYSNEASPNPDDLNDGKNRSFEEIRAIFQARRDVAVAARQRAHELERQANMRANERPTVVFNGPAGDDEVVDERAGRVGQVEFPSSTQYVPAQAIDAATAVARWKTEAAVRQAATESRPMEDDGAALQCPARDPLPDPVRLKSDGNVVFQVACFEMVVDAILHHVCTGAVLPESVRFDIIDPISLLLGSAPIDRRVVWSGWLCHASCTPHMLTADKEAYATLIDNASQLDAECQQQLRASARIEAEQLLLTSPTQMRLVVTLSASTGLRHTFVAVGTPSELPTLVSTQVGSSLGIEPKYFNSLANCREFMALMLPSRKKHGGGGGSVKRQKTIGGSCPGPAAKLINQQAVADADARRSDMATVLDAISANPTMVKPLVATPVVRTVRGTTVPGVTLDKSNSRSPTLAETAAVGGREFVDVTSLVDVNPLVDQAVRRLARAAGTSSSAVMAIKDVAQAQRAVQHKSVAGMTKQYVLNAWNEMSETRPYTLTLDLQTKIAKTVNILAAQLANNWSTFIATAERVAPFAATRIEGKSQDVEGPAYNDKVLALMASHNGGKLSLDIAKALAAYMQGFDKACNTVYNEHSKTAFGKGGKASTRAPVVSAVAVAADKDFGPLFVLLLENKLMDPAAGKP